MLNILRPYILTFIPIFVAVNALGNLPLYVSLTEELKSEERRKVIMSSIGVATAIALAFIFIGKFVLRLMGVSVFDFQIAGGILLLILSVNLLLPGDRKRGPVTTDVGIFPLGTPMITGPAVLTTILVLRDVFGWIPTMISFILNMAIAYFTLTQANFFIRIMGKGGSRAFSKVADIFLAAIAVTMIRNGIISTINIAMSIMKK
ncbi:MAG: hypothetical protein AMJ78_07775 [Omnitrophica WOR_2 bacterium SM23_29]|nr:MAG: hypothetical protein AMJ78_07775 [Omnitrophica WOR_2 bacterium SM23_29]